MRPPSSASLLLFLASLCVLAATDLRATYTVDTAFLTPLSEAINAADEIRTAEFFWPHFDDLVYLTRKGDPAALAITQRLLLRENLPCTCTCCSGGFSEAIFADDRLPPNYLENLASFELRDQRQLLWQVDRILKESIERESWEEQRSTFLARNPALAEAYNEWVAMAASEAPTSFNVPIPP